MQNQIRRQDSKVIQAENELLRAENLAFREAILKKTCLTCGGPTVPAEEKPEQLRLRMENARLKDELLRASTILNDLSCTAVAHLPMPGHPSSVRMG